MGQPEVREEGAPGGVPPAGAPELSPLVRSLRRLTIAVWCLVAIVAASYIAPWVFYLLHSRSTSVTWTSGASAASPRPVAPVEEFDNDFHARPPEEQIRRATVILLTELRREPGKHREIIKEIVKRQPGVRFYYNVGDDYAKLSHFPAPSCQDCEGDGSVVFLIGNPAQMAMSMTYKDGRVEGMGDMPLDELRRLAREPGEQSGSR